MKLTDTDDRLINRGYLFNKSNTEVIYFEKKRGNVTFRITFDTTTKHVSLNKIYKDEKMTLIQDWVPPADICILVMRKMCEFGWFKFMEVTK